MVSAIYKPQTRWQLPLLESWSIPLFSISVAWASHFTSLGINFFICKMGL